MGKISYWPKNPNLPFKEYVNDALEADLTIDIIKNHRWCAAVLRDGYRNKENFLSSDFIVLNFHGAYTLDQMIPQFTPYRHIIGTTEFHKKDKYGNGDKPDRFLVILGTTSTITNAQEYNGILRRFKQRYSGIDQATTACHLWGPITDLISFCPTGQTVEW